MNDAARASPGPRKESAPAMRPRNSSSPDHPAARPPRRPKRAASALALVLLAAGGPLLAAPPEPVRVATLVPFGADALARVPGRAVVVATVRRSMVDAVAEGVIDLGSPHAPSFERLAESGAQLVVADRAMHAALADKLRRGGAEVLLIDTGSVASTLDGIRALGRQVGAGEEMERAVREAEAGIAASALTNPVPTLPLFGAPGSFLVVTDRTWLGDLLERLGFRNLAAASTGRESFPGYVQVSDELLASLEPALVLLVAHGEPAAIREAFLRRAAADGPWKSFAAAPCGVHVLDAATFNANPGLALPEAARRLHRLVAREGGAAPPGSLCAP